LRRYYQLFYTLLLCSWNPLKSTNIGAGPSGFEPETAGFLSYDKSPVLYLAELRAHSI
jgi:hypothetical protein